MTTNLFSTILAQAETGIGTGTAAGGAEAAAGAGVLIVQLVISLILIIAMWKTFAKAGKPGWAAIVPIYNIIVLLEIVGRPVWWVIMMLIPFVNIIFSIIVMIDLAKSYGKGGGFAAGLILLPFIFLPILGFGSAQYQGPAAQQS